MSYATSLLAAYPSSYGTSTLLSDNLVRRSSFDNLYQPSVLYGSTDRLLSDDLAFNQITHDIPTYHPPLYSISNSTSVFPTTNYQNSTTQNFRRPVPPNDSFASLNDITEYSESLVTASNTNTASSVAHSINDNNVNGSMNMFSHHQPNYNKMLNNVDSNRQPKSIWSSQQTKTKGQSNEISKKSTFKNQTQTTTVRTQPSIDAHKDSSIDKLNDDVTPVQSPQPPLGLTKHHNHLQRNATMAEIEKRAPSIDVQAWINDTKKGSPIDEKQAEQVWSVKIGQLHMIQAQNEKEKTKSSRALPHAPKKVDNKPFASKIKPVTNTKSREPTYEAPHDSYFDTLFEGDFFRKPSTNNYSISSSFHQPKSTKNKLTSSLNNLNTKHVSQRKTTRYEPPTTKRSQPAITTTSWRKQWPKQNDNTAKRLHYGDYVRHSTKDALLQTAVKPSPWSDFMDLKKGNLYSLSREEKKELYNQSKTYGERVRYRNFAMSYDTETSRSHRHSAPLTDDSQEYESGNETPRQRMNNSDSKSVSRTSKRPGSGSTANKTYPKQTSNRGGNRSIPNQISRTTMRTDRSNINRQSENDDDDDISNHDINHKYKQQSKKKNVRYAKLDSNGRTTNNEDENDNKFHNHGQRTMRTKNRDIDDDLFTVREEKTLESFEGARYKKR
ncbi:unnamed protein product [Rotaria sp. Silwood1]|nr:unnamed protein product [Rotaria sp. Silwood1]CAF1286017.1 unnamed protein product [Rotaria sp. Silwood1]CAF3463995.1 unnamed protein product [Rotaria sp. Silwood1]CAF4540090.1 unnamed protein product [Rotaria sp. Silwood1]